MFKKKQALLSSARTDQSQFSFPGGFRHEIEHALTGTDFWHQKSMTDWPVAYLGFGKGGHGERAEREPITESEGGAHSGVQGQSPWSGGQGGEAPWSWNTFCFWTFNRSRKFAHFFWNLLENGKKRTFSYKVACKKISWSGQRGGIAPWPTPSPLNTPLMITIDCL